jgi:hypothetical protein
MSALLRDGTAGATVKPSMATTVQAVLYIVVRIRGREFLLSPEEARELKDALRACF